jgi:hypothetical protein
MNQTRRLAAILAADVAGYVTSTYEWLTVPNGVRR